MTPEILYRAWHIGEKKMYTDVCIMLCPNELRKYRVFKSSDNLSEGFLGNDKHFEIMQYTGLLDRNEKKIFDGDIVEIEYSRNGGGSVPDKFVTLCEKKLGGIYFGFMSLSYIIENNDKIGYKYPIHIKIIGNVFNNPEIIVK